MKKLLVIATTVALLVTTPVFVPQTQADTGWVVGAAFRIGGAAFHLGYRDSGPGPHRYYYRSRDSLHAPRGHYDGGGCGYEDGYYHHDQHCPLVRGYLGRGGVREVEVFVRYAPGYRGHDRGRGYREGRYGDDRGYDEGRGYDDGGYHEDDGYADDGYYDDDGPYDDDDGYYEEGYEDDGYREGHSHGHGRDARGGGHGGHHGHDHRGGACRHGRGH